MVCKLLSLSLTKRGDAWSQYNRVTIHRGSRRTSPYAARGGSLGRPVTLFLSPGQVPQIPRLRRKEVYIPGSVNPVQPEACGGTIDGKNLGGVQSTPEARAHGQAAAS
jgi:hypothetical protein